MKRLLFLLSFTVLIIFISVQFHIILVPQHFNDKIFEIRMGDNATQIAEKLQKEGIIKSAFHFVAYVKILDKDKSLHYGRFLIKDNKNMIEIVSIIFGNKVIYKKVTIPEGLTIDQTCQILSKRGLGNIDSLKHWCYDKQLAADLVGMDVSSLEGFLYPETYHIPVNLSEKTVIKLLVEEFHKQTVNEKLCDSLDLKFYDLMKLASIVEKEHKHRDEMRLIAGVYLNRIKKGMRLEADPTVRYALLKEGIIKKKVYYSDLKIDSPYNTYIYSGLPPTPICSPSKYSLRATINAEKTDYLFFFAGKNGYHVFSRTYEEHLTKQEAR